MNTYGFVFEYDVDAGPTEADSPNPFSPNGNPRTHVYPFLSTPEALGETQPIREREVLLVYAGRIDNREEIAYRLARPRIATSGDGYILSQAYLHWGKTFPRFVLGEYSFALYDRRKRLLVAGRDAFGVGLLFFHRSRRYIRFASNLDLLLSALPEEPPLDPDSFVEYFAEGGGLGSTRTMFKGISGLEQGTVYCWDGHEGKQHYIWQPEPDYEINYINPDEYDDHFRYLLFSAVKAALRCSGNIFLEVSGGLDSSTVCSVAALLQGSSASLAHGMFALSLMCSKTLESDESFFQLEIVRKYGLKHYTLDRDLYLEFGVINTEHFRSQPDCSILLGGMVPIYKSLCESLDIRASVGGIGGDQLFCGDSFPPVYLHAMFRQFKWHSWVQELWRWALLGRRSLWNLAYDCTMSKFHDYSVGLKSQNLPDWMTASFRSRLKSWEPKDWADHSALSDDKKFYLRNVLNIVSALPKTFVLHERRLPLLYRPLVEFMLAIPWEHKLRVSEDRVIQRRALKGIIPEAIRNRRDKVGNIVVALRGLRENWRELLDFATGKYLNEIGLVDSGLFFQACERWRHGLIGSDLRYLMAALSLEVWLRLRQERGKGSSALTLTFR